MRKEMNMNQSSIDVKDVRVNMTLYYDRKNVHKLGAVNYVKKDIHATKIGFPEWKEGYGEKVQKMYTYPNGTRLQRVKAF